MNNDTTDYAYYEDNDDANLTSDASNLRCIAVPGSLNASNATSAAEPLPCWQV